MDWLQPLINGLAIGGVYALFALGYTLVFSILGVINFAHGAVFTLGAYLTYALAGGRFSFNGLLANAALPFSLPFALALILGSLLAGGASLLIEQVAFRPLRKRQADSLLTLISSLGAAVFVVNLIQILVGAEIYTFPSNIYGDLPSAINFGSSDRPIQIRTVQIILFGVAIAMFSLLTWLINGTRIGHALKAVAEDATTASLLGIDPERYIRFTFFLSGVLGGLAGALVGTSVSITGPYFGIAYGLKGLSVMVLGGLGNIPGTIAGGLVLGLAEAWVPPQWSGYRDAVAFALLFAILLIRPQGLFSRARTEKV